VLISIGKNEPVNVTASIFEAKAGIRLAKIPPVDAMDPVGDLSKNAYIKSLRKQLRAHMDSTGSAHSSNQLRDVAKTKKISQIIKKVFPKEVSTALLLPDEDWAKRIYTPEIFASTAGHLNVLTTHNCTIEARLYLEGAENLFGIPFEKAPGACFKEKRTRLFNMTIDDITTLVKETGGFSLRLGGGCSSLYLIPSGFVTAWASEGAHTIRWGVSSDDQDTARVALMLNHVMQAFPELNVATQPMHNLLQFVSKS
jgi:hypothetical protein